MKMHDYYSPGRSDSKNASASENGASRGGTKREFGMGKMGNTFPRPNELNNASQGQTDGHNMGAPSQTRAYPNKMHALKGPNTISLKAGQDAFSPKAGEAKSASGGYGPNSMGGTNRNFMKYNKDDKMEYNKDDKMEYNKDDKMEYNKDDKMKYNKDYKGDM